MLNIRASAIGLTLVCIFMAKGVLAGLIMRDPVSPGNAWVVRSDNQPKLTPSKKGLQFSSTDPEAFSHIGKSFLIEGDQGLYLKSEFRLDGEMAGWVQLIVTFRYGGEMIRGYVTNLSGKMPKSPITIASYLTDDVDEVMVAINFYGGGQIEVRDYSLLEVTGKAREVSFVSKTVKQEADEILQLIKSNALNFKQADLTQIEQAMLFELAEFETVNGDFLQQVHRLLRLLDNHSFIIDKTESESLRKPAEKAPELPSLALKNHVGVLQLPSLSSIDSLTMQRYANHAVGLLNDADAQATCGWIIDLRDNSGGNMWPMLGAVSPLLPMGKVGAFVDKKNQSIPWLNQGNAFYEGANKHLEFQQRRLSVKPMVVLQSKRTASSGEATLVALTSESRVKTVGEPTRGLITSNENYKLKSGNELFLTNAWFQGRDGTTMKGPIAPDVESATPEQWALDHLQQLCEKKK